MAVSVKNIIYRVRALIDEYTDDGTIIPESDVKDLQEKSILFADMAHKELFESSKLDETKAEPTTIISVDDVTEVNYKADQAIVYYITARLAPFENKELVNFFEEKYEQLKKECRNKAVEVPITDVYGFNTGGD